MIEAIGFMVGAYIIVRLVAFFIRGGQPKEYWAVRVLSGVAGVITLFVMGYLFVGPGDLSRPLTNSPAIPSLSGASAGGNASVPAPSTRPQAEPTAVVNSD